MKPEERKEIRDLFKAYTKDIFGVAYYILKDQQAAKDIIMDVFEVLLKQDSLAKIQNKKAWLLGTSRNLSLKKFNKQIKTQYGLEHKNIIEQIVEKDDQEELIIKNANEEAMLEQLALLKPLQSKCITLYYLKGLSYQQIAKKENISMNDVKSNIQNGKRNLKIKLEKLAINDQR